MKSAALYSLKWMRREDETGRYTGHDGLMVIRKRLEILIDARDKINLFVSVQRTEKLLTI